MPSPQLFVETITFRGNDVHALPLLVGGVPVTVPEWTRSGARFPAAFVAPADDGHVRIGATFFSPDLAGRTTTVFASRLDGAGHAVQDIAPAPVIFDTTGHSADVVFRAAISPVGVDRDRVRWQWQFQVDGVTHDASISEHEIAVALHEPRPPWSTATPAPGDTCLPWWEVLHRASTVAAGTATVDLAAARITDTVFREWGASHYKWDAGAETFASDSGDSPSAFDCLRFLSLIDGAPPTAREIIDCSDTATIVSTFAAILGCPFEQLTLFRGLDCNVLKKVGHNSWEAGVGFPLHEIAVSEPTASDPRVWDGCLLLSGDETIRPGEPTTAVLPSGMTASKYLTRLLSANRIPFAGHILRGPLVRPIRPLSNLLAVPRWDEHLSEVADRYDVQRWPAPVPSVVPLFDPMAVTGDGRRVLVETACPPLASVGADTDAVARVVCTWPDDPGRRVRVTVYLCRDADAARRRLVYLLGKFGTPLTRLDGLGIMFASRDRKTIVGTAMNVTFKVLDAGERAATALPDASQVLAALLEGLARSAQPL